MILAYFTSVSAHCSRVVPCLTGPVGMHPGPPKAKITNATGGTRDLGAAW
jgi:hypothetical protein